MNVIELGHETATPTMLVVQIQITMYVNRTPLASCWQTLLFKRVRLVGGLQPCRGNFPGSR